MLEILGEPVGKERPRRGQYGNFYTPRTTINHERAIAFEAIKEGGHFDGDVEVTATFYTTNKLLDLDNALKTLLDGLQKGRMFKSDRQVKRIIAELIHVDDNPRTVVFVDAM